MANVSLGLRTNHMANMDLLLCSKNDQNAKYMLILVEDDFLGIGRMLPHGQRCCVWKP